MKLRELIAKLAVYYEVENDVIRKHIAKIIGMECTGDNIKRTYTRILSILSIEEEHEPFDTHDQILEHMLNHVL